MSEKTRAKRKPHRFGPGNPWRFKKGNPGGPGRPKKIFGAAYERMLLKQIPDDRERRTFMDAVAQRIVKEAIQGKAPVLAAKELADRVDGRPEQAIVGEDGGPLEIVVKIVRVGGRKPKEDDK